MSVFLASATVFLENQTVRHPAGFEMEDQDMIDWKMFSCGVAAVCCSLASADTLVVPDEYGTIQAAIDAAQDGDTVLVSPGVYTGSGSAVVDMKGKAILLQGIGDLFDPKPVIDGEGLRTCLVCESGETFETRIRGLEFSNGSNISQGGGVRCASGTSPFFQNCCFADNFGSGVSCEPGSSPSFENCFFRQNTSTLGVGLQVAKGASVLVENCAFDENQAIVQGGGINVYGSVSATNCTFDGNIGESGGGGIRVWSGGSLVATGCIFDQNGCGEDWLRSGGGLLSSGAVLIEACEFRGVSGDGSEIANALVQIGGSITSLDCIFDVYGSSTVLEVSTDPGQASFHRCAMESGYGYDPGEGLHVVVDADNAQFFECSISQGTFEGDIAFLQDCLIDGCTLGSGYYGGGVSAAGLTAVDCTFGGGNVANFSCGFTCGPDLPAFTADDSSFTNCSFGGWGPYQLGGADLFIDSCRFGKVLGSQDWLDNPDINTVALRLSGGSTTVRDSVFERMICQEGGCAITVLEDASAVIERCIFDDNEIWYATGFIDDDWVEPAGVGGASIKVEGQIQMIDSKISKNRANRYNAWDQVGPIKDGAAVYGTATAVVEISGTTICGSSGSSYVWGNYTDNGGNHFSETCCDADFNHDGFVDGSDLAMLLGRWGAECECDPSSSFGSCFDDCWVPVLSGWTLSDASAYLKMENDLNGDLMIDGADLSLLLGFWGPCETP